jgi:CBS domain-containing protein
MVCTHRVRIGSGQSTPGGTALQNDPNLELDVDHTGSVPRLRICVAFARGYTSEGAAPTITADCTDEADLQREVARLKRELDQALERSRALLGGTEPAGPERPAARAPAPTEKAHLDTALKVEDLMTREVRTLGRNDKLSVADELMRLGRLRHAVVLDEQESVAGVLSQRDIFLNALAWSLGQGEAGHRNTLELCVVKDVMHGDVVTIAPDAPLTDAAARMVEHKIGCLPVVVDDELVGILTESDFLTLLSKG